MSTEELFNKAVFMIREGPPRADATNEEKLKFYGLYKQATVGSVYL
jgi:acyl-CoA-binding protein